MFNFLNKKEIKTIDLQTICNGKVISITNVPDQMFAHKLLGDGVGFEFEGNTIYAPCDGKVVLVSKTNHAIGIKLKNDAEILIHVGMDTVNLNGKGLIPLVKVGHKIKLGQPILKVDKEFMDDHDICLITPLILTNGSNYHLNILKSDESITLGETVLTISKK